MEDLVNSIRQCNICSKNLPLGPRPVFTAHPEAKIILIGQAPGTAVHKSGIPWDDPSGNRLREWLGVDKSTFYNPRNFALVPMGFCYPGKGKSGDLPPREECAPQWHNLLFEQMPQAKLKILIGSYAQKYYLQERNAETLTQTVKNFANYLPDFLVLPHPSPRNNLWLRKNPWFEKTCLPVIQQYLASSLSG